jgi:hypothetical protein
MKDVLTKKCGDPNDYIRSMAVRMKSKFDKYWGECNLLMAIAAILDPRFKMVLIRFCFPIIYQEAEAIKNIEYVERILNEIYDVYVNEHNSNLMEQNLLSNARECSSGSSSISAVAGSVQSGMKIYESFIRSADTVQQPLKSDLEIYLEDGVYIPEKGLNLVPWNGGKQILSSIAFCLKWLKMYCQHLLPL